MRHAYKPFHRDGQPCAVYASPCVEPRSHGATRANRGPGHSSPSPRYCDPGKSCKVGRLAATSPSSCHLALTALTTPPLPGGVCAIHRSHRRGVQPTRQAANLKRRHFRTHDVANPQVRNSILSKGHRNRKQREWRTTRASDSVTAVFSFTPLHCSAQPKKWLPDT